MKHFFFMCGIVGTLALSLPAEAATFNAGQEYSLKSGEVVVGNLYSVAGTASLSGVVRGDSTVLGGTVLYAGSTTEDLLISAGTVTLTGAVSGDARLAGGSVLVSGPVGGDLAVLGGQVRLTSRARVLGDVVALGASVLIDAPVEGSVYVAGGTVRIDSFVRGDVTVVADSVMLGPLARIQGNLNYRSPQKVVLAQGSHVGGQVLYRESKDFIELGKNSFREAIVAFLSLWIILKFFMTLLVALIIALLFNRLAGEVVQQSLRHPWRSVLMGFALLVSVPVASALTFMTIVAVPLGVLALLCYAFFLILAVATAGLILGVLVLQYFEKTPLPVVDWRAATVGVLVYTALGFLPIVGWVVRFSLLLAALGAFSHYWYEYIWQNR